MVKDRGSGLSHCQEQRRKSVGLGESSMHENHFKLIRCNNKNNRSKDRELY